MYLYNMSHNAEVTDVFKYSKHVKMTGTVTEADTKLKQLTATAVFYSINLILYPRAVWLRDEFF